eukprot:TRINITY_DN74735_c0_g1_i1.p1 TRINITY_DN74735_c0_g1~~TRINITY_DN74735_c0_g1_i1.p1  ORF type:complete len:119 (-),score=15.83 TRINITY_DN74735_c0_g1_i1:102-458(-)
MGRGGLAVLSSILCAVWIVRIVGYGQLPRWGFLGGFIFLNKFKGLSLYHPFLWSVENESSPSLGLLSLVVGIVWWDFNHRQSPSPKGPLNACPICLENEETVDHLLLNCIATQGKLDP